MPRLLIAAVLTALLVLAAQSAPRHSSPLIDARASLTGAAGAGAMAVFRMR